MRLLLNRYACRALFSAILSACGLLAQAQVTSTDGSFTAGGTTNLTLRTNGTTRATIDAAGNVGINLGGSSSLNRLQIGPNPSGWSGNDLVVSNANGGLAFFTGSSESYIWGSKSIAIRPNGNMAIWTQPDGRVGFGTSTPRGVFDVANAGDIYLTNGEINGTTNSIYLPGHIYLSPHASSNISYIQARRADNSGTTSLRFRTYNSGALTEALHVEGNGRVGIGTLSPTEILDVNGTVRSNGFLKITNVGVGSQGLFADDSFGSIVFSISRQAENETRFQSFGFHTFYSGGSSGTEKMRITSDGRVGIGIENPSEKLEVNGNLNIGLNSGAATGYGNRLSLRGLDDSQSGDPIWLARYNSAANQTELRVNVGNDFGQAQDMFVVGTHHWNGGTWFPHFSVHASGNIGIGTTNPQQKLHVNGTIYSTEVKVDVAAGTGPDYVFAENYQLPTLTEVKSYIDQHKHLPEVPSAKEMEANGVNLGEMNLLLLKKIEELTLHLIHQSDDIKTLKKRESGFENYFQKY